MDPFNQRVISLCKFFRAGWEDVWRLIAWENHLWCVRKKSKARKSIQSRKNNPTCFVTTPHTMHITIHCGATIKEKSIVKRVWYFLWSFAQKKKNETFQAKRQLFSSTNDNRSSLPFFLSITNSLKTVQNRNCPKFERFFQEERSSQYFLDRFYTICESM